MFILLQFIFANICSSLLSRVTIFAYVSVLLFYISQLSLHCRAWHVALHAFFFLQLTSLFTLKLILFTLLPSRTTR